MDIKTYEVPGTKATVVAPFKVLKGKDNIWSYEAIGFLYGCNDMEAVVLSYKRDDLPERIKWMATILYHADTIRALCEYANKVGSGDISNVKWSAVKLLIEDES